MKRRSFFGALAAMVLSPIANEETPHTFDPILDTTDSLPEDFWRLPRTFTPDDWSAATIAAPTADTYDKLGVLFGGGHGRPIRVCT